MAQAEAIYQVRGVLEGLAVRLFAANATDRRIGVIGCGGWRSFMHAKDSRPVRFLLRNRVLPHSAGRAGNRSRESDVENIRVCLRNLAVATRAPDSIAEIRALLRSAQRPDSWRKGRAHLRQYVRNAAVSALAVLRERERGITRDHLISFEPLRCGMAVQEYVIA